MAPSWTGQSISNYQVLQRRLQDVFAFNVLLMGSWMTQGGQLWETGMLGFGLILVHLISGYKSP